LFQRQLDGLVNEPPLNTLELASIWKEKVFSAVYAFGSAPKIDAPFLT
jgi:hypothetical protein